MGLRPVSNTCARGSGRTRTRAHARSHRLAHPRAARTRAPTRGRPPRPALPGSARLGSPLLSLLSSAPLRFSPRPPGPARPGSAPRGARQPAEGAGGRHKVQPHCQTYPAIAAAGGGGALRVRLRRRGAELCGSALRGSGSRGEDRGRPPLVAAAGLVQPGLPLPGLGAPPGAEPQRGRASAAPVSSHGGSLRGDPERRRSRPLAI